MWALSKKVCLQQKKLDTKKESPIFIKKRTKKEILMRFNASQLQKILDENEINKRHFLTV